MKGFTTKALHGLLENSDSHNSLRTPIYDSVSYEFESAEAIEDAFRGRKAAHSYSRITNPTVAELERKYNNLAGGLGTIAVASGMAAISNTILNVCQSGENIVTTKYLFGNTYSLFEETLKGWGLEVKYVDLSDLKAVEAAIDGNTRLIYLETITNPQLAVYDIKGIAALAREKGVLTMLDSTLTPPYLFSGKEAGVNIEVISSTKYISGGATSVGGLITDYGNYDPASIPALAEFAKKFGPLAFLNRLRKATYRNLGACLSAHSAYLQTLGLETLALRIEKSNGNALEIATFLKGHPKVANVNYPGLPGTAYHEEAYKLFTKGLYGGLLTFELESQEACFTFMNKLKMIRRATNLNDNKTLIIHPHSTIYSEFSEEEKVELGVSDRMIRLSVGIEDVEDLIEEIGMNL